MRLIENGAIIGSSNRSQKERIITPLICDLNEAFSKVGISDHSFMLKDFSDRLEISGGRILKSSLRNNYLSGLNIQQDPSKRKRLKFQLAGNAEVQWGR